MSQETIHNFYSAFQKRDHEGMIACYHPDITFSDPAFTHLQGKEAGAMWHMLCERGTDLELTYSDVSVSGNTGTAHWEPTYTFSTTGRKVHNIIDANFIFADDGRIVQHRDYFNFWRWSRQALGPMGLLLGWTPIVQNKVRQTAMVGLKKFIEKHPEYQ